MLNNEIIAMQHITASKENNRILSGTIEAIETERLKNKNISCAILHYNQVRILIPMQFMNIREDKRVLRSMISAEIDYIVTNIDYESEIAIANRAKAMKLRSDLEFHKKKINDTALVRVTGVGKKHIIVDFYGVETIIKAQELQHIYINQMRDFYAVGDKIEVKILDIDINSKKVKLSHKALLKNPFDYISKHFIINGEYLSSVIGYSKHGIIVELKQGIIALCRIPVWLDLPPNIGDLVIAKITEIYKDDKKIYATLVRIVKRRDLFV